MEEAQQLPPVAAVLNEAQTSTATHRKLIMKLRKYHDANAETFLEELTQALQPLLLFAKRVRSEKKTGSSMYNALRSLTH